MLMRALTSAGPDDRRLEVDGVLVHERRNLGPALGTPVDHVRRVVLVVIIVFKWFLIGL